jgi:hypothetical protein
MLDVSCLAEDQRAEAMRSYDMPRPETEDKRPDARIEGIGDLVNWTDRSLVWK